MYFATPLRHTSLLMELIFALSNSYWGTLIFPPHKYTHMLTPKDLKRYTKSSTRGDKRVQNPMGRVYIAATLKRHRAGFILLQDSFHAT